MGVCSREMNCGLIGEALSNYFLVETTYLALETLMKCACCLFKIVDFNNMIVQVGCEGYDYPDDPYVLAGSCGLEYTIDRTTVNSGLFPHHILVITSLFSSTYHVRLFFK